MKITEADVAYVAGLANIDVADDEKKDLAEQLKNGQPEAAQMTLQKMTEQLKSAKLSPEQLQKILQEVSKAVDPANNYGKVAEHLKGVSLKGESKVAYEEAAAAAQSDAQAALSQEKVPRAYQGAVKDYFDDIKK